MTLEIQNRRSNSGYKQNRNRLWRIYEQSKDHRFKEKLD